jgi:hypothetical protein
MDGWSDETKLRHRDMIAAVREIVTECARANRTTTYGAIRQQIEGVNFRTEGPVLGAISVETYAQRGVMVSAGVVDAVFGLPGEGFFELARSLNYTVGDPATFHSAELERVYEAFRSSTL